MNKSISSSVDAATFKDTQRQRDLKALKTVKIMEAEKHADPNLTAMIVPMDSKTLAIKWKKADKVNELIL